MRRSAFILGLTAVLVGYFAVWLPHEAAGLSYIGLEMGELAKFLPQVRSGAIRPGRSLFYLPPVALSLVLILASSNWPERWQTWATRLLASAFSLIALPAFEAFGTEPEEWLWRTLMIGLVFIVALLSPLFKKLPERSIWIAIAFIALAGGLLPTWLLLQVNRAYAAIYQTQVPIGVGAYLNLAGQLLLAGVALVSWRKAPNVRAAVNRSQAATGY